LKNPEPVPSRYDLVRAYRNQNQDLWQKYCLVRSAIAEECASACDVPLEQKKVAASGKVLEAPLDGVHNEWYLFHGTSPQKCISICSNNFKLTLAGSGATWKDTGKLSGMPLYGLGIYLAEHITKSDEYSGATTAGLGVGESFLPVGEEADLFTCLLCRVVGGRTNTVTTNDIERTKLRQNVFDGPYHSIFGDRVTTLGRPFNEVVVYDKDQIYPEFLLVYSRHYE